MQRGRTRRAQWFPAAQLYTKTIPERELDDPPDSGSENTGGDLIIELSGPPNENTKGEDTLSS